MRSRIEGALCGHALGDLLGRPVERRSAPEIRRAYQRLAAGAWPTRRSAENTALGLTLACVNAYAGEDFELQAATGAMLQWTRTRQGMVGGLTRTALALVEEGLALPEVAGAIALEGTAYGAGTGSLMRAAPPGLARQWSAPALATEAALLSGVTHADPRCLDACVAFAVTLSSLIEAPNDVGAALERAHLAVARRGARSECAALLSAVCAGRPLLYASAPARFVLMCLERGLVALRDARSFDEGLVQALCGAGDSDTVGAVTGALLGARFASAVPRRWAAAAGVEARLATAAEACARFRKSAGRRQRSRVPAKASVATTFSVQQVEQGETARRFFDTHGYVVVRGLFSKRVVERARARFDPLFDGVYETGLIPDDVRWMSSVGSNEVTREIRNAWRSDRAVARIALDARVGRLCARLARWSGTRLNQAGVLWKPPGAFGVGAHQDASYLDWFVPHEVVTCWVALDDVGPDSGPLEYCSGTHRLGLKARLDEFDAPEDPYREMEQRLGLRRAALDVHCVVVPAGSAAFHHGLLLHGSGRNESNGHRRAIGIHCMSEVARFHPTRSARLYSRYHPLDGVEMDEAFFPILWTRRGARTSAADAFLRGGGRSLPWRGPSGRR